MRLFTIIAVLSLIATPALGQVVSGEGENGAGGDGTAVSGVKDQPANVVHTFGGIRFQVVRLLQVPSQDSLRLILRVTEAKTSKQSKRRVAFVAPVATLIDDVGNTYFASAVQGIGVCKFGERWQNARHCDDRDTQPTSLTPSLAVRVLVVFKPWEEFFSSELANLATTAMFSARIGIYEGNEHGYTDVIINNVELP